MDKSSLKHFDICFNAGTGLYNIKTPDGECYEISSEHYEEAKARFDSQKKDKDVAHWLWILLGFLGAHRFYIGDTMKGILLLLTLGGFVVGWLGDFFFLDSRIYEINAELEKELMAKAIEDTQKDRDLEAKSDPPEAAAV